MGKVDEEEVLERMKNEDRVEGPGVLWGRGGDR